MKILFPESRAHSQFFISLFFVLLKWTFPVLLFFLFAGSLLAADLYKVQSDKLNLRAKPGRDAQIVRVLAKGETLTALGEEKGWLRVETQKKERGYVLKESQYVRRLTAHEESLRKKAELEEKIKREKEKVSGFKKQERDVVTELDRIDRNLKKMSGQLAATRKEHAELQKQYRSLLASKEAFEKENEEKKKIAAQRLKALYKLETTGHLAFLGDTESLYDFVIRRKALQCVLEQDDRLLGEQILRIAELKRLSGLVAEEEKRLAEIAKKETVQIQAQSSERKKREELLSRARNLQKQGLSNVASMEKAMNELDKTIERFIREEQQREKERQRQLQAQRKREAQQTQKTPQSRQPQTSAATGSGFGRQKGTLRYPVAGKIISRFGQQNTYDMNVRLVSKGLGIRAAKGTPIRAVYAGTVVYSEWLYGYGNMVIIDHGDQYHTVYAHAETLLKKPGDKVSSNEAVARVGEAGSMNGPMLYFEIRHKGKAINPDSWMRKS